VGIEPPAASWLYGYWLFERFWCNSWVLLRLLEAKPTVPIGIEPSVAVTMTTALAF